MASHQVAISKASFAAALLRPDPVSVSRDEIARFHTLLDAVTAHCSPPNVQDCKNWLLENVVPSAGRITALAKFLTVLSESFAPGNKKPAEATNGTKDHSTKKKRLHLLYLLNDILHHTKYHATAGSRHTSLASNLQPQLVNLFTSAASFDSVKNQKHHRKLLDLLDIWGKHAFQGSQFIESLRQAVKTAGITGEWGGDSAFDTKDDKEHAGSMRDKPYVMPATHGDPDVPYYDLPAANLMPHIVPNSHRPIDPSQVKPLQFVAGPAEESLVNIVKDFLKDIESVYNPHNAAEDDSLVVDVDQMGQPLVKDEASGELVPKESYYGWSITFCERMKKRKRGGEMAEPKGSDRGRSRSISSRSSGGSSAVGRKRRRRDSTGSSSGGYRARRRSRTRSRSGSKNRLREPQDSPRRSRSRDHSPAHRHQPGPLKIPLAGTMAQNQPFVTPADQIDNPFPAIMPPAPSAPSASAFQHNFPIGPGGLPVPPPPPFHKGPWPPPPPALPAGASYNPGPYPSFATTNFQPGSFIPPPPPGWNSQHHAQRHQHQGSDPRQDGPSPPPPPPPPLDSPWQESPGRGRGYRQANWDNHRGGYGRGGRNTWNNDHDPRQR